MNAKMSKYDVVVIGAGPAGMMAAIRAGELGLKTILLEKNASPGKKLLLTGKGRCNITQEEFNLSKLLTEYGKNNGFLRFPFSVFGVRDAMDFFNKNGLETKIERGKRVFPKSDKAEDVLACLEKSLKAAGVVIRYNSEVKRFKTESNSIKSVVLADIEIEGSAFIVATGGKSYPQTGSTGDGYRWLTELGHTIIPTFPSLVPLKVKEEWPKKLQGLSLKNVAISTYSGKKRIASRFGEMLFTHFGISGPIVLDISRDLKQYKRAELFIDLKPGLTLEQLNDRILRDFSENINRQFKNSLKDLLPQRLIPIIIDLSKIDPEKKVNTITKAERISLVKLFKKLPLTFIGLLGFETAIVTSGGVSLKEVDSKTMRSRIIDNLFLAGEILDIDGPSGGYNLQIAWSTGYCAGTGAYNLLKQKYE